jgi:hypothetical protein
MYARTVSPLKKQWLDSIAPDLSDRLMGLQSPKRKERETSRTVQKVEKNAQQMHVYKRDYPLISAAKGKRKLAVIPLEDLGYLARAHASSNRRVKNFPATIMYLDHYIHYGDKFFSILELHGKIEIDKGILDSPPAGIFTAGEPRPLIDNLYWILALCRLKKKSRQLGFITLDAQGNGVYRFTSKRNAFEALDSSLYALGQLVDEIDRTNYPQELRLAKKAFEHHLKLFDA